MPTLNAIYNGYFDTNIDGWIPSVDTCTSDAVSWEAGRMMIENPYQVGCNVNQYVGARQSFELKDPIVGFNIYCEGPETNMAYWMIRDITTSAMLFENKGHWFNCTPGRIEYDLTAMGATIGDTIEIEFGQRYANGAIEFYIDNVENLYTVEEANVVSMALTVDTNDCIESCTINGLVSWGNIGGMPSDPTDLEILYNGNSILIDSGVVLDSGEVTSLYSFSIPDLTEGIYTIEASPNSGTTPQIITVNKFIEAGMDNTGILLTGLLTGSLLFGFMGSCDRHKKMKDCELHECKWINDRCIKK